MLKTPVFVENENYTVGSIVVNSPKEFLENILSTHLDQQDRICLFQMFRKMERAHTMSIKGLNFRIKRGLFNFLVDTGLIIVD